MTSIEKAERRVLIPVLVQILVLVLVLDLVTGTRAFAMPQAHAASVIYRYARGLDLTRRDLQFIVRGKGCPCDLGKDVLHPSVVSEVVPMAGHVTNNGAVELSINGGNKPKSGIDKIIWNTTQPLRRFVEFLSPATTQYGRR